jgi:hypothetical protein
LKILPYKKRTLNGPHATADLARLQDRFRSVLRRHARTTMFSGLYRATRLSILILICIAPLCWQLLVHADWPVMTVLKHIAAFPNCGAARAVGLAPANEGEPGYWPSHDADNDGKACEPLPR